MIKKRDKKGETTFWIVGLILALGVVLLVFLGYNSFINKLSEYPDAVPEAFSIFLTNTCQIHVDQNNRAGFCSQFFEVSDDLWANCPWGKVKYGASWETEMNCDGLEPERTKCEELERKGSFNPEKVLVNGESCSKWLGDVEKAEAKVDNSPSDGDDTSNNDDDNPSS